MLGNSKRFGVQLLLPIWHRLSKRITTHDVHGWAVQNDITWPYVHLLTVGWSSDSKSRKVWGGQVAPRILPRNSHMLRWFYSNWKICCKCEMLGPSIRSFFVTSGDHDFVVKQIRHLQKRCIHIIHACRIQIYKFKQGKDVQCHWAISTAAIQLLIGGFATGDNRMDPRENTAMYDTEPKNWPMVFNPGTRICGMWATERLNSCSRIDFLQPWKSLLHRFLQFKIPLGGCDH